MTAAVPEGGVTAADASGKGEDSSSLTKTTRIDTMLADVFSLLSLFFLAVGRSRECPAMFCQISCMKQLLDHLSESAVYTEADITPYATRIAELRDIIRNDEREKKHPPQLTKLMMRKLEGCQQVLDRLLEALSVLSVELLPIHKKLVTIRRQLFVAAAFPRSPKGEVKAMQDELRRIEACVFADQ